MTRLRSLVLIHGLMGTLNNLQLATSRSVYHAFAPDLLGYGQQAHRLSANLSLSDQVDYLAELIATETGQPVILLGHSVGGAIAMLLADHYPERVSAVVNVEGNFTLNDAFWSASVAKQPVEEVEALIDGFHADPAAWLARAGVEPNTERLAEAERWLACQGGATVRAMGRAVVEATGVPEYLRILRRVFERTPVHLVAGERSRDGWDVPDWALDAAASVTVMPGVGHMMMLEDPAGFGRMVAGLLDR
ncbi:alpha/beta hydrolase [Crenobacter sp. SG2305]|uniref:alpha/beta fold hydrolase n=1 Tax=Crenobacter oryzisoli TaxID=3056844 RepID=UPI0025AAFDB2|nr:alpha/beta hydrolase [Crenobacter sp. SG2305]MDN0085247.1 alpha/beta hydrolase [Crenobacter sp. SG2305]